MSSLRQFLKESPTIEDIQNELFELAKGHDGVLRMLINKLYSECTSNEIRTLIHVGRHFDAVNSGKRLTDKNEVYAYMLQHVNQDCFTVNGKGEVSVETSQSIIFDSPGVIPVKFNKLGNAQVKRADSLEGLPPDEMIGNLLIGAQVKSLTGMPAKVDWLSFDNRVFSFQDLARTKVKVVDLTAAHSIEPQHKPLFALMVATSTVDVTAGKEPNIKSKKALSVIRSFIGKDMPVHEKMLEAQHALIDANLSEYAEV